MPKLSVVMACFNEEKNIRKAIDSILRQSFTDFELIVVDDGSIDGTLSIIEAFRSTDGRIVVLKNDKNRGHAYSLNVGLNAARAEIIARMDADDQSLHNRFAEQYMFLSQNPDIGVLGTGAFLYLKKNGNYLGTHLLPEMHTDIIKNKYKNTFVYHPSVMARKDVILNEGGYCTSYSKSEDVDLWLRIMDRVKFHNLQIPLIKYSVVPEVSLKAHYDYVLVTLINMLRRKELLRCSPLLLRFVALTGARILGYKSRRYKKQQNNSAVIDFESE